MKPLKLLLTALVFICFSRGAIAQVQPSYHVQTAFIDTFIGPFVTLQSRAGDYNELYGGQACTELKDSGFAIFVDNNTVVKTDKNGKIEWATGSTVVPGYQFPFDFFNLNTDRNGNIIVESPIGAQKFDYKTGAVISYASFWKLEQTLKIESASSASDGSYFVAGMVNTGNLLIPTMAKFDSTGTQEWVNTCPTDFIYCNLIGDNDGGAVIVFDNGGYLVPDSINMFKVNSEGNIVWQNNYNINANDSVDCTILNVLINPDDNSISLLIDYNYIYSNNNFVFSKYDSNGIFLSSFSLPYFTGINSSYIVNNSYIITGETKTSFAYEQMDNNGTLQHVKYYPFEPDFQLTRYDSGSISSGAFMQSLVPIEDTGIAVSGAIYAIIPNNDGEGNSAKVVANYLLKYKNDIDNGTAPIKSPPSSFLIYPNPTLNNVSIVSGSNQPSTLLKIYNVLGQQMFNSTVSFVQNQPQTLDVSNLSSGFYLLTMQSGSSVTTAKFIKQ